MLSLKRSGYPVAGLKAIQRKHSDNAGQGNLQRIRHLKSLLAHQLTNQIIKTAYWLH